MAVKESLALADDDANSNERTEIDMERCKCRAGADKKNHHKTAKICVLCTSARIRIRMIVWSYEVWWRKWQKKKWCSIKNARRVCEREKKSEYYFSHFSCGTHSIHWISFHLCCCALCLYAIEPAPRTFKYSRVHVMQRNEIKWTRTLVCSAFTFSIFHFHNVWVRYLCQRASSRLVRCDLS